MKKKQVLIAAVSNDELELPLAVEDSFYALDRRLNIPLKTTQKYLAEGRAYNKKMKFVLIEDD